MKLWKNGWQQTKASGVPGYLKLAYFKASHKKQAPAGACFFAYSKTINWQIVTLLSN